MTEDSLPLICAFHPKRETLLRCNRCGLPICVKCAQLTPTGYRCPKCIREQQKVFITTKWHDHLTSILIAGIISFLGSLLTTPFGFFVIFVTPIVGAIIATVVRKAIKNRRSPRLHWIVATASLIASSPILLINILRLILEFEVWGLGLVLPLVWPALYSTIVTTTVYYRIKQ